MTDAEDALRESLRVHANDVRSARRFDLEERVQDSAGRRSVRLLGPPALVAAAIAAVIGGVVIATADVGGSSGALGTVLPGELVGAVGAAPDGMHVVSSRGVQITVPASWSINNTGCNQTSDPTVVRGLMSELFCYTPEPADQDIAIIGAADLEWRPIQLTEPYRDASTSASPDLQLHPVTVDGHG